VRQVECFVVVLAAGIMVVGTRAVDDADGDEAESWGRSGWDVAEWHASSRSSVVVSLWNCQYAATMSSTPRDEGQNDEMDV
jgi:hypothetical protein